MSEPEPIEEVDTSALMDYPNREVLGLEPPGNTGGGGLSEPIEPEPEPDPKAMTKAELIAEADRRGVEVDESMTKAEIAEALG